MFVRNISHVFALLFGGRFSWAVYDIHSECLLEKVRHIVRPTETPGTNISESLLKTLKLNDCRPLERAKSLKQVLTEVLKTRSF